MKHKNSIEFYNKEAEIYDHKRWHSAIGQIVNQVQLHIVEKLSHDLWDGRLLEVAAGTGRFTQMFIDNRCNVTALDASQEMLYGLHNRLKQHSNILLLDTIIGDAKKIPIKSEQFDTVVCINALSHIPNHRDVLSEVYRVLKPGGVFLFNIPNYLSLYFVFGIYVNLRKKAVVRNVYTRWYSLNSISKDLSLLGFHIEELIGEFHFPSWTPGFFSPMAKLFDRTFRQGVQVRFAPVIFIRSRKRIT